MNRERRLDGFAMSHDNRPISVQTLPIGIEPAEFHTRLWKSSVQDLIRSMKDKFRGVKVIVGVDRLDCIKGLPQKLLAFERFLEKNPSWVGKATLIQVVVPSRDSLESHKDLKEIVQQLVGRINGKYGACLHSPPLATCGKPQCSSSDNPSLITHSMTFLPDTRTNHANRQHRLRPRPLYLQIHPSKRAHSPLRRLRRLLRRQHARWDELGLLRVHRVPL